MKANKTLVLGTVLTAAGIGAAMGGSEAKADSIYTVQKGDTIYKISRKFVGDNSLAKAIIKENNLKNPDKIYVGDTLEIPTKAEAAKMQTSTATTAQAQTKNTMVATQKTYVAPKAQKTVKTTYTAPKANYTKQAQTVKTQNTQVAKTTQTQQATQKAYVAPKATTTQKTYVAPKTTTTQKAVKTTYTAPKAQATKQTTQNTYVAPKATTQKATVKKSTSSLSGSEASAKSWIAMKESTNNYSARNGRYIGKYQLDSSYLNGDYSAANQERVAEKYVKERYGSWSAAKAFHQANGWY